MNLTLTRVRIPAVHEVAKAIDYRDMIDVANTVALHQWNNDDFVYAPQDELATFTPTPFRDCLCYLARIDGLPVGRLVVTIPLDEEATTANLDVAVVPGGRGRGIGSALLARGEELAADGGRVSVSVYSEFSLTGGMPTGPLVAAASGSHGLPADDLNVRFALAHGYELGQVEVMSVLDLPLADELESRLRSEALSHSDGYRIVQWFRHTPDELLEAFAAIRARMVLDVPHEGIVLEPEHWNAERVRDDDQRMIDRSEPLLTTVALHEGTGEIVAYTTLAVPSGSTKAEQHDTLVTAPHRGHRLGLLVKLATLPRLAQYAPGVRRILTWNAGENSHMLAINTAMGFQAAGLVGNWQKTLPG